MAFFQNSGNVVIAGGTFNVAQANHSYNVQAVDEYVVHSDHSYNVQATNIENVYETSQTRSESLFLLFCVSTYSMDNKRFSC